MLITICTKATNVEDWQIRGIPLSVDYESLTDENKSKVTYKDSEDIFKTLYENLPVLTFAKLMDRFVTHYRTELEKQ